MFGAAIAAREGKLLTLATGEFLPKGRIGDFAHIVAATIGAAVSTMFVLGGVALVRSDRDAGDIIAVGIPTWVADLALPIGVRADCDPPRLARVAARDRPRDRGPGHRRGHRHARTRGRVRRPGDVALAHHGRRRRVLGAPIFVLLGGIAVFASLTHGNPPVVLMIRRTSSSRPRPASRRFRSSRSPDSCSRKGNRPSGCCGSCARWFGWAPGGTAVAAATLCAFFTLFTGGSGVTILVLGGLLLPALIADGYRERFSIGLLTASGSLGLLFPLSLPLMLYGIVSQKAAIEDLFIGGILPGLVMLGLVGALGVRESVRQKTRRTPFEAREAMDALWAAKWELLLPVFILVRSSAGSRRSSSRRRWRRSTR